MIQKKTSYGAFEAKTHLGDLLTRVEQGDRILITRHGRPVAELVPVRATKQKDLIGLGERALKMTQNTSLPKGKTLKDLINAGRNR